jgi:hypothetical protein
MHIHQRVSIVWLAIIIMKALSRTDRTAKSFTLLSISTIQYGFSKVRSSQALIIPCGNILDRGNRIAVFVGKV